QVGVGVAAPNLPAVEDCPPVQARDRQVTVDRLVEAEVAGIEGAELLHPVVGALRPTDESGFREVLEPVVVLSQAQGAGVRRGLVVLLIEEGARELSKVGHFEQSSVRGGKQAARRIGRWYPPG